MYYIQWIWRPHCPHSLGTIDAEDIVSGSIQVKQIVAEIEWDYYLFVLEFHGSCYRTNCYRISYGIVLVIEWETTNFASSIDNFVVCFGLLENHTVKMDDLQNKK